MPVMGKKKKISYDRIVFWGIIVAVVAIALLLWGPFHKAKRTPSANSRWRESSGRRLSGSGRSLPSWPS
jgi:hypothetical protein